MNKNLIKVKYEVCCGGLDDAYMSYQGGADRIELNSALFLGGLTPSIGVMKKAREKMPIEIIAMIRPRKSGFCYTDLEYEVMKEDAKCMLEAGADGLAFGFLNADGSVDVGRTKEFVELCGDKQSVFHRAIDVTPNIEQSVKVLCDLNVTRVLTSGGQPTATQGAQTIKRLIDKFSDKIEILAGGGLNMNNVVEFINTTGTKQIHSSARSVFTDSSVLANPEIYFGGNIDGKYLPEHLYKMTNVHLVRAMVKMIKKAGDTIE